MHALTSAHRGQLAAATALAVGRWWTLRVADDAIQVLAKTEGTSEVDAMEYSQLLTVYALALADLDEDGSPAPEARSHPLSRGARGWPRRTRWRW